MSRIIAMHTLVNVGAETGEKEWRIVRIITCCPRFQEELAKDEAIHWNRDFGEVRNDWPGSRIDLCPYCKKRIEIERQYPGRADKQ